MEKELFKGEIPCIRVVNENLRLVEQNKPLTLPLSLLNTSCDFRKRYKILYDLKHEEKLKEERKLINKKYNQRPEVKKRKKEYYKEYHKKYNQRPEVKKRKKEYNKEYYQRPEVKKRKKEYDKEYHKKYNQRPEVKKRKKEYRKKYYQKKKKEGKWNRK